MTVPGTVAAVLDAFDARTTPFTELDVWQTIANARKSLTNPSEAENLGAWAEELAFALVGGRSHESPWGTYFCPMGSGVREDGTRAHSPDIAGTPGDVVDHWALRAASVSHPVLKARYADLVWEMGSSIDQRPRNPDFARVAIDAYLASVKNAPDLFAKFVAAHRALNLSLMLRDEGRVQQARETLLLLHKAAVAERKLWWSLYDRIENDRNSGFSEEEREGIVADLEDLLRVFSDATNPETFNPHQVQGIAERLGRHYGRLKKPEDGRRLQRSVGEAFEAMAGIAGAMAGAVFLQTAVNSYRRAGMSDDSKRVRRLMEEKIGQARQEMTPIVIKMEVKNEDLKAFVDAVVVDDLGQSLANIASAFLPKTSEMEELVDSVAEAAPISAHVGTMIMAADHVAAKIGSVSDDGRGRLIQQTAQALSFNNLYLWAALDRFLEKHGNDAEIFAAWANRLELFSDVTFLLEGINAWLADDLVKAVHVLVPQIEHGLRMIAEQAGEPVTKSHRVSEGVGVSIGMGDILNSKSGIVETLGSDITLYFLALYADPRGRNIRNRVAHGLLTPEDVSEGLVRWLMHTLLVLGIWEELSKARR